jgi:hypothetical protein
VWRREVRANLYLVTFQASGKHWHSACEPSVIPPLKKTFRSVNDLTCADCLQKADDKQGAACLGDLTRPLFLPRIKPNLGERESRLDRCCHATGLDLFTYLLALARG